MLSTVHLLNPASAPKVSLSKRNLLIICCIMPSKTSNKRNRLLLWIASSMPPASRASLKKCSQMMKRNRRAAGQQRVLRRREFDGRCQQSRMISLSTRRLKSFVVITVKSNTYPRQSFDSISSIIMMIARRLAPKRKSLENWEFEEFWRPSPTTGFSTRKLRSFSATTAQNSRRTKSE